MAPDTGSRDDAAVTRSVKVSVTDKEVTLSGLARACAGGIDDSSGNGAHLFTLQVNAKRNGVNLANAVLSFAFAGNVSHDPLKKAKFLVAANPNLWAETVLKTTLLSQIPGWREL